MIEKGYMIFEELGRGYHGIVYRAKSPSNKNVALKFTYHNAHEVYGTGKFFLGDIGLYNKTRFSSCQGNFIVFPAVFLLVLFLYIVL